MKTVHDVYFITSTNLLHTCNLYKHIVVIIKSSYQFYSDNSHLNLYAHAQLNLFPSFICTVVTRKLLGKASVAFS